MAQIIRPLHVGISVGSMETSLRWYRENLNFELVEDSYEQALQARVCFLQKDSFQIELFEYQNPQPLPQERRHPNEDLKTIGTKHVAFEVNDMASMKERFQKNNVDIAHEADMGNTKVMFIRDPSGVLIELMQYK